MKFTGNYHLGKNVKLGENVKIGDRTIIYDNTWIEDNVIIANDCIIGEPIASYYHNSRYLNPETRIGSGALIRSHSIIYAGCTFGSNLQTGHRATIREFSKFGESVAIGTQTDIQGFVEIGNYTRLHSGIFLCQRVVLGDFVLIAPGAIFADDRTPPSENLQAPVVQDYAVVGAGAVILPGVNIARHCVIAAGSVLTRSTESFGLYAGNPARRLKDTREVKSQSGSASHYPWPRNFSRGMPWEGGEWEDDSNGSTH